MKQVINLSALIILILTLSTSATIASTQKKYDGHVLLENGEKIYGKIHLASVVDNQIKLTITLLDNKTEATYKAIDIQSYTFEIEVWNKQRKQYIKEKIFYTKKQVLRAATPFGDKHILIHQLVNGKINYYTYYYLANTDIDKPIQQIYYIEKSNAFLVINRKNYQEIIKNMTYDFPELSSKIGSKGYRFTELETIIKHYNLYMQDYGEEHALSSKN